MKKIWARIGVSFSVTDFEYEKLKERAKKGDIDLSENQARYIIENGEVDGDSYIPETIFWF